jgi:hypothetical protein
MKDILQIESVNPKLLTHDDYTRLHELIQDIWAYGIGEFVQCISCNSILSKQDIFGYLPREQYQKVVAQLMRDTQLHDITCPKCGGETTLIYGNKLIESLRQKYQKSVATFLSLAKNENQTIVWLAEGYIDKTDTILLNRDDLWNHYHKVGIPEIKQRINTVLWEVPDEMLLISTVGMLEQYRSPFWLLLLLDNFFQSIPEIYLDTPGIMEVETSNIIYQIVMSLGWKTLGIEDDPILRSQLTGSYEWYDSRLVVFHDPVRIWKRNFAGGPMQFLRRNRVKSREGVGQKVKAILQI